MVVRNGGSGDGAWKGLLNGILDAPQHSLGLFQNRCICDRFVGDEFVAATQPGKQELIEPGPVPTVVAFFGSNQIRWPCFSITPAVPEKEPECEMSTLEWVVLVPQDSGNLDPANLQHRNRQRT
jgi:hypothetical protein